jgi:hypothetical protein
MNGKWDVAVAQTMAQRLKAANEWVRYLQPTMDYAVDMMEDEARLAYGAWPERLAILEHGRIQYYGGQGPWGYHPSEVEKWLEQRFGDSSKL